MKRQSLKAARQNRARAKLRNTFWETRGATCEACAVSPAGEYPPRAWTDLHEVLTRGRGGDPTDADNILLLCGPCHHWVTTHETDAKALGLVRGRTASEHNALFKPWLVDEPNPEYD